MSQKTNELFDIQDKIYLYDLTNTYFEGEKRNSLLAQYGRSKEKRTDAKLIVLGLVVNVEGFIKYSNIFEGSMSDCKTLSDMIDKLHKSVYKNVETKPLVVIDAGIFPSHIGFESAISMDCKTLTRSMLADNSPYYESGLRTVYTTASGKFLAGLYILNGWQRIQKPEHYNKPSAGFQLNYKPNSKWQINYSNFIGSEKPDSVHFLRHFHNFYLIFESKKKNGFILGFDIGSDKNANLEKGFWFSPVIISWFRLIPKLQISLHSEYYQDAKQIIILTQTANGFQTFGLSTNVDFFISEQILFRTEAKSYFSKDAIFLHQSRSNYSLTLSLAVKIP